MQGLCTLWQPHRTSSKNLSPKTGKLQHFVVCDHVNFSCPTQMLGSVVYTPSTSVKISQVSAFNAAARATEWYRNRPDPGW